MCGQSAGLKNQRFVGSTPTSGTNIGESVNGKPAVSNTATRGSNPCSLASYTLLLIFSLIYVTNKLGGKKMHSIDTIRLRKWLGYLGMLLPIIVLVLCMVFGEAAPLGHLFPDSISATYYFDSTITPFMIILGAAGILLMCYRGYTWVDDLINTLTGVFAWGICLFPCSNPEMYEAGMIPNYVGTF